MIPILHLNQVKDFFVSSFFLFLFFLDCISLNRYTQNIVLKSHVEYFPVWLGYSFEYMNSCFQFWGLFLFKFMFWLCKIYVA